MAKKSKVDDVPQLITDLLRLPVGPVDLAGLDTAATPGFGGDKEDASEITEDLAPELGDLQERLFAAGRVKETTNQKILIVLQGMDTSGKGGTIRHAIGMVDPQGVKIKAFKAPTEEETRILVAYLRRHAQTPLDPARYPEVNRPSGEAFRVACSQCHVLPDPQRPTAQEWPRVVARMQENMEWMNRVVGSQPTPGEPQLRVEEINAFLQKYGKPSRRPRAGSF